MERLTGLLGILVLLSVAFALSSHRKRIAARVVVGGILMQVALAFLMLKFEPLVDAVNFLARLVQRFMQSAEEGAAFVFGQALLDQNGPWGFIFAIKALPAIIFFAAVMAVLYHWGIMQRIIAGIAWVLQRTLGVTAVEAIVVAANVFVGQTEAPLCVRPYLSRMTRSQVMALMTGGFATIAGALLVALVGILGRGDEARELLFAKHLIIASVLSAPAAFVMAKIMVPETEEIPEESIHGLKLDKTTRNALDAAAAGASDGLKLALNVAAMLIAFVGLLALLNWPLEAISMLDGVKAWRESNGIPVINIETLLGWVLSPLAWTMGIPWSESVMFGGLLGQKVMLTEIVAYLSLSADMASAAPVLSDRSAQIAAYALCGFGNIPSIAIQIGGLTPLAPERRSDFASLGLRAMIGGAMASWMTACVAGFFIA